MSSFAGLRRRRMVSAGGENTGVGAPRRVKAIVAKEGAQSFTLITPARACSRYWGHRILAADGCSTRHGRPSIVAIEHGIDQIIGWCGLPRPVVEESSTFRSSIGSRRIGAQPWSYLRVWCSGRRPLSRCHRSTLILNRVSQIPSSILECVVGIPIDWRIWRI